MSSVLVTAAAVLQLLMMMMMIPTNTAQLLTIEATRTGPDLDNNIIQLICRDTSLNAVAATFYRQDLQDEKEVLIGSNVYVVQCQITIQADGFFFCNNSMGQSNFQPINVFPDNESSNSNSLPGVWGDPYTAKCPHQIGLLSHQQLPATNLYSMNWTIVFSDGSDAVIDSNTIEYQLIGSSLRISTFTPFVQSLVCRLTVTGEPPFQGQPRNRVTRTGILPYIGVEQVFSGAATIIQSPQDYTAAVGSSAVFQCTARVPNIRNIGFEIFNDNITTADNNCNRSSETCNKMIDSHPVSLTCDYSIGYQISCTLSVNKLTKSSDVICRVLNASTVEAMETAQLLVTGTESSQATRLPGNTVTPTPPFISTVVIYTTRLPSSTASLAPSITCINHQLTSSLNSTGVIYGMAATIIIFIASSVFLILLVAVLCHKYQRQQEQIYDYAYSPANKRFLPPPSPPLRITTSDNPAYETFSLDDCVAYGSRKEHNITLKTQSSIVSNV